MAITAAQATKINKMNRAAKDASLGTAVRNLETGVAALDVIIAASGSQAVTSGEASASRVVISTGLAAVNGFIVSERTVSGSQILVNATAGSVAGTIIVTKTTSGTAQAANDVVTYVAF